MEDESGDQVEGKLERVTSSADEERVPQRCADTCCASRLSSGKSFSEEYISPTPF